MILRHKLFRTHRGFPVRRTMLLVALAALAVAAHVGLGSAVLTSSSSAGVVVAVVAALALVKVMAVLLGHRRSVAARLRHGSAEEASVEHS